MIHACQVVALMELPPSDISIDISDLISDDADGGSAKKSC